MLMGQTFWEPLMGYSRERPIAEETAAPSEIERIAITDSAAAAVASVTDLAIRQFGLTYGTRIRRRRFLGE